MDPEITLPKSKGFLVCDQVLQDAFTGKITAVSVFNQITFRRFPGHSPAACCYLQLTDAAGRYTFSFSVLDLENDQVISSGVVGEVVFEHPHKTRVLLIPIFALPFPHTGK